MRSSLFALVALLGCASTPGTSGDRESGQSGLMDQTFAGKNACNPDGHLRPFIIEWDATDASGFEALAANDIVFVRYEGCSLTVLDGCRDEDIKGSLGAYKTPQWTSGALETVSIENEGELYAKLPLGAATLGGRASAGEKFHMEYYVAGTRSATRSAVHREDIAATTGCEGSTHFVHSYNLGAFALGSAKNVTVEAGASAYGFSAGGSKRKAHSAEKKGGDLGVCTAETATELSGCQAPIRLTLRPIQAGANPDTTETKTPDESGSLSAAMAFGEKVGLSGAAEARLTAAAEKASAGDGNGCLAQLDKHDGANPKQSSREPTSPFAAVRAKCLFLAGKCKAGKQLARKAWSHQLGKEYGPEFIDAVVDNLVAEHCQGGELSDRDQLLSAVVALGVGAVRTKETPAVCEQHVRTIERLGPKVKPEDRRDVRLDALESTLAFNGSRCLVRAGACKKAWTVFEKYNGGMGAAYDGLGAEKKAAALRSSFESSYAACKAK